MSEIPFHCVICKGFFYGAEIYKSHLNWHENQKNTMTIQEIKDAILFENIPKNTKVK